MRGISGKKQRVDEGPNMENGEALCTEYGTKNEKEQIVGFVMHLSMLSPRGGGGGGSCSGICGAFDRIFPPQRQE